MDIFGKMGEVQQRMQDIQQRLERITVIGDAQGMVKVTMTATRNVTNVDINDELIKAGDKEQLEDLLTIAFNRASEQAASVAETESAAAYKDLLPNFPGLGI